MHIKKTFSHFHKMVPARQLQIADHYEVFRKLLFQTSEPPESWDEEAGRASLYERRPTVNRRRTGRTDRPSKISMFVNKHKKQLSQILGIIKRRKMKRVQAEDVFDIGAENKLWREDDIHEVYYMLHRLFEKLQKLDEGRTGRT
eukprot:TRINITY_DN3534_c0_g1_i1.p1 TRINITY_DN3534_c0_g1~~TRINITY_DN3534_c0_g1_i1.p1  ORF type:complete len:144 (+),score=15.78 TRINITY_DN3534_c0_g1_i1:94-525(+)